MKKGINIWSFAPAPLRDVFALARDAGFEGVETALGDAGEISLTSTERDLLSVRRMAEDHGLALYSLSCGLCWTYALTANDPAEREKAKDVIKKQIDTAHILGAETVLVVPGWVNSEFHDPAEVVDYAAAYDRSLEALCELKGYAAQAGVEIGIENVWNKFLLSPLEMRDFIDKIDSPFVGAYFDIGNVLQTGYPEQWIRILGNRIKKVHVKDYRLAAGGLHGFVDLLAGDVNFPAVMQALTDIGYDGWLSPEMPPPYTHYPEALIYNTSLAMDKILGRK